MSENICILVADEHPLFREGVVHSLAAESDCTVVGQASSGEDALTLSIARDLLPDVVLPDIAECRAGAESWPQDPLEGLTERESEILKLVGRGLTNRELGEQFHLSEKTIKHCITNILQKLHVRTRVEAAMLAVRGNRGNTIN